MGGGGVPFRLMGVTSFIGPVHHSAPLPFHSSPLTLLQAMRCSMANQPTVRQCATAAAALTIAVLLLLSRTQRSPHSLASILDRASPHGMAWPAGYIGVSFTTQRFDLSACSSERIWIDVGAHELALTPPTAGPFTVLAFEPQLRFFSQLRKQHRCVFPINAAVSPAGPTFTAFHVSQNGHSSSLREVDLKANEEQMSAKSLSQDWSREILSHSDIQVMVVRLSDTVARLPPCRRVEFLKIDAQGVDLDVVKSLEIPGVPPSQGWLSVVDRIQIETPGPQASPLYAGGPSYQEIRKYFEDAGWAWESERWSCCLERTIEMDVNFTNPARAMGVGSRCPLGDCHPEPLSTCTHG